MSEALEKICTQFKELLDERFKSGLFTTEDTIRYLFFHACTEHGVKPNSVTLEDKAAFSESESGNEELDTFVQANENIGLEPLAIEFKYHRKGKNTNPPRWWLATLLCDFYRLQHLAPGYAAARRLSVYVASKEMEAVIDGMEKKGDWGKFLVDLMRLSADGKEHTVTLPGEGSITNKYFIERAKGFSECTVKCLMNEGLADGNTLRIFEIVK